MIDDLYDRIGGRQTVVAATEAFDRRVLADESVSHFFKSTDMALLRARQSMFVSMLLGGRVVIYGKRYYRRLCAVAEEGVERHSLRCFSQALSRGAGGGGRQADKRERVMKHLESKRGPVLNR